MLDRYEDVETLFPDELKGEALPFFIYWLIEKVLLLEIDTPSEDEAHTIFLTMNDRGLSLNSAEMMKAYIIQQVAESDRIEVNHQWQDNINKIEKCLILQFQWNGKYRGRGVYFHMAVQNTRDTS